MRISASRARRVFLAPLAQTCKVVAAIALASAIEFGSAVAPSLAAPGASESAPVAGTVTTLAALDLRLERYDGALVHGHVLTLAGARAQRDRLAALPLARRRGLPALEPERAPVIVAGAIVVVETLVHTGVDAIRVSERDLLDGVAFAAAELD